MPRRDFVELRGDRISVETLPSEGAFADASSAPLPLPPTPKPLPHNPFAVKQCLVAGVKLSKDGRAVSSYDPSKVTAGLNFLRLFFFAPALFNFAWYQQTVCIYAWSAVYALFISDSEAGSLDTRGTVDLIASYCYQIASPLTRFVLGLYISLVLARTYYANRGAFGTVFGSSMGATQMIVSWVRAPDGTEATRTSALRAQALLVRWVNAAYRLLVMEVRGNTGAEIGSALVSRRLLTDREWSHLSGLSSRATHVYTWMSNVTYDLYKHGYLCDPQMVTAIHYELNQMRGANVWGLPSLPLPYTLMVTAMVKIYLFFAACYQGGNLRMTWPVGGVSSLHDLLPLLAIGFELFVQCFLYQGMLDLHGWLYSPNGGEKLGHLPADNFLDFVQGVTSDMVHKSGAEQSALPYTLDLAPAAHAHPKGARTAAGNADKQE